LCVLEVQIQSLLPLSIQSQIQIYVASSRFNLPLHIRNLSIKSCLLPVRTRGTLNSTPKKNIPAWSSTFSSSVSISLHPVTSISQTPYQLPLAGLTRHTLSFSFLPTYATPAWLPGSPSLSPSAPNFLTHSAAPAPLPHRASLSSAPLFLPHSAAVPGRRRSDPVLRRAASAHHPARRSPSLRGAAAHSRGIRPRRDLPCEPRRREQGGPSRRQRRGGSSPPPPVHGRQRRGDSGSGRARHGPRTGEQ
jgi:hypothetical protein